MTGGLVRGLLAAIGAAALYGVAPVAQGIAARDTPPSSGMGLALTLRLARRPIWLAGLACEIVAFVLEALAFATAPTTLVAPVLACDMLVFVLVARPAFGERMSARGVRGALAMAAAVGLVTLSFAGSAGLGRSADAIELWAFLAGGLVTTGVATLLGNRVVRAGHQVLGAAVFSAAAGITYGLATLATRQIGRTFTPHDPWQLLGTPAPYVLVGCSVLGIGMAQRGLQAYPLVAFPLTSALSAFIPVVVGAALLGDEVPGGLGRVAFSAALVLLVVGVTLIGRDRSAAEAAAEPGH
ncbi:MAG TPA: hypothetical protein VMB79_08350 [Jatrophihabitans sp.]|nr:hypothetical protein [Jatrophihabitans sp.]